MEDAFAKRPSGYSLTSDVHLQRDRVKGKQLGRQKVESGEDAGGSEYMLPELNATRQTLQSTNSGYNNKGYETGNSLKTKQGLASTSMSSVNVKSV